MYTLDIRKLVIKMYHKLKSLRFVQSITNISKSSISRWNLNILPFKKECKKNIHVPIIIDTINLISKINPFYNIYDVQIYLKSKLNIICSYQLIRCVIHKNLKLSYKKTKFANYINDNLLKEKTTLFCSQFKKLYKHDSFIASIDEIGFSSKLNPLYAWSEKGKRTYIKNKINNKTRTNKSVCTCITSDGNVKYNISLVPYNKTLFLSFLKSLKLPKNTILLMDNVCFHHSKEVVNYIKTQDWSLLFTPPYSPWFNPIENVFSVVKNQYRKSKNIENSFNFAKQTIVKNCINYAINKILST